MDEQEAQRNGDRIKVVLYTASESWCQKQLISYHVKQRCSLELIPRDVVSFQLWGQLWCDMPKGEFLGNPNSPYRKSTHTPWPPLVPKTTVSEIKSRESHMCLHSLHPRNHSFAESACHPEQSKTEVLLKHNLMPGGYFTAEKSWASNPRNSWKGEF